MAIVAILQRIFTILSWKLQCNKQLVYENRGKTGQRGCWEAHHVTAGGPDTASNCEILCCECHAGTGTYGRP